MATRTRLAFLRPNLVVASPQKAAWLKSEWHASRWVIRDRLNRRWLESSISWEVRLPDGSYLTDEGHKNVLEVIRKIVYLSRSGPRAFTRNRNHQVHLARGLICVVRFMVQQGLSKLGAPLAFSLLQPHHFKRFIDRIPFGPARVLEHRERIQTALEELTKGYSMAASAAPKVVDIEELAIAANVMPWDVRNLPNIEELIESFGLRWDPRRVVRRHHPDYRSVLLPPLEQAAATTVETHLLAWRELFVNAKSCGDGLSFNPLGNDTPAGRAKALVPEKRRTPTIRAHIALHYLNAALRWILVYGAAYVEYLHELRDAEGRLRNGRTGQLDFYAARIFNAVKMPKALEPLRIDRYQNRQTSEPRPTQRSSLTVNEVGRLLIAACFIAIGTFSGRRHEELLSLDDRCVEGGSGSHLLVFHLEKGTMFRAAQKLRRPIPDVVALASTILRTLCADSADKRSSLFNFDKGLGSLNAKQTQQYLDFFADYIESPLIVEEGKGTFRWYVRPHELRRFLAIAFFWHTPNASLDALSWFLGHLNRRDTLRYLQEIVGGKELSEEESEYTLNALKSRNGRIEGRSELIQDLKSTFGVKKLSEVHPDALKSRLERLYVDKLLSLTVVDAGSELAKDALLIRYVVPTT